MIDAVVAVAAATAKDLPEHHDSVVLAVIGDGIAAVAVGTAVAQAVAETRKWCYYQETMSWPCHWRNCSRDG